MKPVVFRQPRPSYARWLATAPDGSLERADRVAREFDRHWRRTAPDEAGALEAYRGKVVRLTRTLQSRDRFDVGSPFLVVDVWARALHGIRPYSTDAPKPRNPLYILDERWVRLDGCTPFLLLSGEGGRPPTDEDD